MNRLPSWRSIRVWQRDAEVYLRTWKTNLLPPLLEPLFYLLAFGAGVGGLITVLYYRGLETSYVEFIAAGVIAVAIMFQSFFECTYASFVRMYYQKTYDAIICTPLGIEDVIGGEILWGMTRSVIAAILMLAVIGIAGYAQFPSSLLIIPFAAIGGFFFASLGMIFAAIVPTIEAFNYPVFLVATPMFLFSGTFFPLDQLPPWAQTLAWFSPLTHLVVSVRSLTYGIADPSLLAHALLLVGLGAAACILAVRLMSRRLVK